MDSFLHVKKCFNFCVGCGWGLRLSRIIFQDTELLELRHLIESMREDRHSNRNQQNGSSNGMIRMSTSMTSGCNGTAEELNGSGDFSRERIERQEFLNGSPAYFVPTPSSRSIIGSSKTSPEESLTGRAYPASPTASFNSLPPSKKSNWVSHCNS